MSSEFETLGRSRRRRPARRARGMAVLAGAVALLAVGGGAYGALVHSGPKPQPQAAAAVVVPTGSPSPSASVVLSASPSAALSASPSPVVTATPTPSASAASATPSAKHSSAAPARTAAKTAVPGPSGAEDLSVRLINQDRAAAGVPALQPRADLAAYAARWAKHMRDTGFAHSENATGAGPSRTARRTLTGECIVMWGDASMTPEQAAEKFQEMWRDDPPHHEAQINPAYTTIGVGFYHDETGWWGVHEFGND